MTPLEIAQQLVSRDSVTNTSNAEVSTWIESHLTGLGFDVRPWAYTDLHGISKVALEARRGPMQAGGERGIGYFGHSDVVSVEGWSCRHGGPFDAAVADGKLWGRGACDMKGSVASALAALANIEPQQQTAPLYFFVTGDEESGMGGADLLADKSEYFAEMVHSESVGIIGEPTSLQLVNAHKGACHVDVSSTGVVAHSSSEQGQNANWRLIPFLNYLKDLAGRCDTEAAWQNPTFSPPTLSLNVVLENQPTSANITVGEATCRIFFRPMPDTPWHDILVEMQQVATEMGLQVRVLRPLQPLFTSADRPFVQESLRLLQQTDPLAVCYATDGCCFHQLADLVVLGPGSIEQAHRPDEWIALEQLDSGTRVFTRLFEHFATHRG